MKVLTVTIYDSLENIWWGDTEENLSLPEVTPCFICGRVKEIMVRLKDIDDGCLDQYMCKGCIQKMSKILE